MALQMRGVERRRACLPACRRVLPCTRRPLSVVLTADGRSLPSVPSWQGPPPSLAAGPMLRPQSNAWGQCVPTRVGVYRRCVPSSRLACGNWNALSAS